MSVNVKLKMKTKQNTYLYKPQGHGRMKHGTSKE